MCLAIPARVVEVAAGPSHVAVVEVAGVRCKVDLGLLEEDMPGVGDWVLVHVGFALSRISEDQATEQMRTLALLGEDQAAMEEIRGYDGHVREGP